MNRRNFIHLGGTALSSLLFASDLQADNAPSLIQLPEKVFVTLADGRHALVRDGRHWTYRDIVVTLKHYNTRLDIEVQSPQSELYDVVLKWPYAVDQSSTVLGDHWERTYGDVHFQPANFNRKLPWYFVQHSAKQATCFGVKTGCNSICYWQVGDGTVQLTLDTKNGGGGVLLGDRTLKAASVVGTKSMGSENTFATSRRFCRLMCDKPLLPEQPVYGINDWYITYGNNSADIIIDHTARMAELAIDSDNRPFSVVDSGWARYSPLLPNDCCWQDDFSQANEHFNDMELLADKIKRLGMRPGLWTRPLCAAHNDSKSLLLPSITGRDNPKKPVLDPTIDENLERVKRNISIYRQWGYKLVKHDFTTYDMFGRWGDRMFDDITSAGWHFNDRTKTNAEIILALYRSIRHAAGNTYLMGCNTMSHLSAGVFELNRIGDDTSGREWNRTRKMGVNTLGFRMVQHNTFYAADGDCVGLTNAIPWSKNKQWMQLLAESSSPLFISAQQSATGAEQKAFIKQCFASAAKQLPVAEPLDWLEKQWPERWRLNGHVTAFKWD